MEGSELNLLKATPRARCGKGPSRQIRLGGLMPAVLYGKEVPTRNLLVRPEDLIHGFARSEFPGRFCEISIQEAEDKELRMFIRIGEVQQDPVTLRPLHADFIVVDEKTAREGAAAGVLAEAKAEREAEELRKTMAAAAAAAAALEAAEAAEAAGELAAAEDAEESEETE